MSDKEKPPEKKESDSSDLRQSRVLDVNRLCNILPVLQLLYDTSGNKRVGQSKQSTQETPHEPLKRFAIERTTSAVLATTTVFNMYRRLVVAQWCWMRDTGACHFLTNQPPFAKASRSLQEGSTKPSRSVSSRRLRGASKAPPQSLRGGLRTLRGGCIY